MKESSCDRREVWKHQRQEQWIKILNNTNIRRSKLKVSALLNWSGKRYQGLWRLTNDTLTKRWLERGNSEDGTKISWRIPDSDLEQPSSEAYTMEHHTYGIPSASNSEQHSAWKSQVPIIHKTYKHDSSRKPPVMMSLLHSNQKSGGKNSCARKLLRRVTCKI